MGAFPFEFLDEDFGVALAFVCCFELAPRAAVLFPADVLAMKLFFVER